MCVKTNVDTLYSHMCTSTSEQMCVPMLFSEHGGIPAHANMPKKFDDAGPTFSIYTWAATIELSGPGEGHCKVPFPSAWCPSPNPTMDKNANTRSVCICLCHTKSNLHFKQISHLIKDVDMSHGSLESPPVQQKSKDQQIAKHIGTRPAFSDILFLIQRAVSFNFTAQFHLPPRCPSARGCEQAPTHQK